MAREIGDDEKVGDVAGMSLLAGCGVVWVELLLKEGWSRWHEDARYAALMGERSPHDRYLVRSLCVHSAVGVE